MFQIIAAFGVALQKGVMLGLCNCYLQAFLFWFVEILPGPRSEGQGPRTMVRGPQTLSRGSWALDLGVTGAVCLIWTDLARGGAYVRGACDLELGR